MGSRIRGSEIGTTNGCDRPADISVADDENWFSEGCGRLYDGKAGTALWSSTGVDERSCQRYAAGSVKPPAYFLRKLLRGADGWTWLSLAMDGSGAQWWLELRRARRIAEAIRAELSESKSI